MIWNNRIQNSMKSNNMIEEYFNELRRDNEFNIRNEIIYLNKSIDKYEDIIIFIEDWEDRWWDCKWYLFKDR